MYRKARTVMCYPDEDACVIDDDSACVLQLVELIAFFPILSVTTAPVQPIQCLCPVRCRCAGAQCL
jgi:hypothetical protein